MSKQLCKVLNLDQKILRRLKSFFKEKTSKELLKDARKEEFKKDRELNKHVGMSNL